MRTRTFRQFFIHLHRFQTNGFFDLESMSAYDARSQAEIQRFDYALQAKILEIDTFNNIVADCAENYHTMHQSAVAEMFACPDQVERQSIAGQIKVMDAQFDEQMDEAVMDYNAARQSLSDLVRPYADHLQVHAKAHGFNLQEPLALDDGNVHYAILMYLRWFGLGADLNHFDVSAVTCMDYLFPDGFYGDVSRWQIHPKCSMHRIFEDAFFDFNKLGLLHLMDHVQNGQDLAAPAQVVWDRYAPSAQAMGLELNELATAVWDAHQSSLLFSIGQAAENFDFTQP